MSTHIPAECSLKGWARLEAVDLFGALGGGFDAVGGMWLDDAAVERAAPLAALDAELAFGFRNAGSGTCAGTTIARTCSCHFRIADLRSASSGSVAINPPPATAVRLPLDLLEN